MELRDKKGFITVYAMLAMMFFVVIVTTASITASRKLNLQREANNELFKIYNDSIGDIDQTDKTTIPIYTQAQFVQIADWITNNSRQNEYIYANDVVYLLDVNKFDSNEINFVLKTDLFFEGIANPINDTAEDERDDEAKKDLIDYPYIPDPNITYKTKYHDALKAMKSEDFKQNHKIYLKVDGADELKLYGEDILIASAEDFIKIGTNEEINGYKATPGQNYIIEKTIELGDFLDEIYSENSEKNLKLRKIWENRPDFSGTIKGKIGNEIIINGLEIDVAKGIYGIFKTNLGAIEDLVFTDVQVINSSNDTISNSNFGIIAQTNSGTISDCNILLSNNQITDFCSINGSGKASLGNVGAIVGENSGIIKDCEIQAFKIERNKCYKFRNTSRK